MFNIINDLEHKQSNFYISVIQVNRVIKIYILDMGYIKKFFLHLFMQNIIFLDNFFIQTIHKVFSSIILNLFNLSNLFNLFDLFNSFIISILFFLSIISIPFFIFFIFVIFVIFDSFYLYYFNFFLTKKYHFITI
jgi:hypothetical protein